MNIHDTQLMDKLRPHVQHPRPKVVCLCGSTRFYKTFLEHNYRETMEGNIVLSVGFFPHAVNEVHGEGVGITPEQKHSLDELHRRKIDLADEVLVLNVDGYIGESTADEIAYAFCKGKPIRYLTSVFNFSKPEHFAARLLNSGTPSS